MEDLELDGLFRRLPTIPMILMKKDIKTIKGSAIAKSWNPKGHQNFGMASASGRRNLSSMSVTAETVCLASRIVSYVSQTGEYASLLGHTRCLRQPSFTRRLPGAFGNNLWAIIPYSHPHNFIQFIFNIYKQHLGLSFGVFIYIIFGLSLTKIQKNKSCLKNNFFIHKHFWLSYNYPKIFLNFYASAIYRLIL